MRRTDLNKASSQVATYIVRMMAKLLRFLRLSATVALIAWAGLAGWGQTNTEQAIVRERQVERPLPDIPAMMHEVEQHQKASELIQKNYLYHESATAEESDGGGGVKKTETKEFDVFWLHGVQVQKLVKKNGKE